MNPRINLCLSQGYSAASLNFFSYRPEHLSLKVPNIEFDFDVTVDSVQWQTVTSKLNLM